MLRLSRNLLKSFSTLTSNTTTAATVAEASSRLKGRGAVVGVYSSDGFDFTEAGRRLDDQLSGKLKHLINVSGSEMKAGEARLFYDVSDEYSHVVVVKVGERDPAEGQEDIIVKREDVRVAAGVGASLLRKALVKDIIMDDFSDPEAAAEGTHLALYQYTDMKGSGRKEKDDPPNVSIAKHRVVATGNGKGVVKVYRLNTELSQQIADEQEYLNKLALDSIDNCL